MISHRWLASLHRPLVAASLWAGPQGCSVVIDQIHIGSFTALGLLFYHVPTVCQVVFQNSSAGFELFVTPGIHLATDFFAPFAFFYLVVIDLLFQRDRSGF